MTSTKFFVGLLLIAELSCVWTFVAVDIGHRDDQLYSTVPKWSCTSDIHCTTPDSYCEDDECRCPINHVFNAEMTACLKAATVYGDNCNETAQCILHLKAGSTCNEDNRCTCSEGYHYVHGQCRKSSGLKEMCLTDDDCYANSDFGAFSCKNRKCQCKDNYYQREYSTCRLAAKETGDECIIDSDCRYDENSKCGTNATCYLKQGNEPTNSRLRRFKNGVPKTFEKEVLGLNTNSLRNCSHPKDCDDIPGGTLCDTVIGLCICKPGYYLDPKESRCHPELGENCVESDENNIPNSICRFGLWTCKAPTVPSKDNRFCLPAAKQLGEYCHANETCSVLGPKAFCVNNECTCSPDTHYSHEQTFCWVSKGLGEKCQVNEDCISSEDGPRPICNSTTTECACPENTHINAAKNGCVNDKPVFGDSCSEDEDCEGLANAMCSNKICSCKPNYFELLGVCLKGNLASCTSDDECEAPNSKCNGTECGCADGYVPHGTNSCVEKVPFGGSCISNAQCDAITNGSICNAASKCDCRRTHHYHEGRCAMIKGFGDICDKDTDVCWDEIHPDSIECNNLICLCKPGYSPGISINNSLALDTNNIHCIAAKPDKNGASKNTFFSWLGLAMLSIRFMGLL